MTTLLLPHKLRLVIWVIALPRSLYGTLAIASCPKIVYKQPASALPI